jgi:hypothetical protein
MGWYTGRIREPLLDGVRITLAGQAFIVAPFNIRRMRMTAAARAVLREVGDSKREADSDAAIGAITEIAAVALSANYSEVTATMLEENEALRAADLSLVLDALRRANGSGDQSAGEAGAPAIGASNASATGID